jgi:hypothetical protein
MQRIFAALCFSVVACAQINGITSSAARTVALAPDEAVFGVSVVAPTAVTEEQVLQTLDGTGITAGDLVGIGSASDYNYSGQPAAVRLVHQYGFTVPYSKMKETTDKLEAIRTAAAANNQDVAYSLFVNASQSAVDAARQRIIPELIAEARKRAEYLGGLANMRIGPILSISDSAYSNGNVGISGWISTSSFSSSGNALGVRFVLSVYVAFQTDPAK